jgi:uncharacterized membrane protein YuzA (DUF378 family)
MTKSRSAFSEAVATGPFAVIYWGTIGLAAIAVIAGIFGTQEQRAVTGAIVFSAVAALAIVRYLISARIEKQRRSSHST